jgi:hypothetical protein
MSARRSSPGVSSQTGEPRVDGEVEGTGCRRCLGRWYASCTAGSASRTSVVSPRIKSAHRDEAKTRNVWSNLSTWATRAVGLSDGGGSCRLQRVMLSGQRGHQRSAGLGVVHRGAIVGDIHVLPLDVVGSGASVRPTSPERSCVMLSCARAVRRATGQRSDSHGAHAGGHQKSSERRKPMKAIVQETYGKANVLELRDIDKPVQNSCGSVDVPTATGGTR